MARFEEAGAPIIGIRTDPPARNKAFADKLGLKFPILSDEKRIVARAYGVLIPFVRLARRSTFVIDKEGIIQRVLNGGEALLPENAQQACTILRH